MAEVRVYIQPRLPAASSQTEFYDFSKHVEFDSLEWEQNDQGNASTMRANIYSIMPVSTTNWASYPGATEAEQIQNALNDYFYHLDIPSRTEVQIRDVSTSPHTILWGGVITRVSENRDGGAVVGSLEAVAYTALLNESVALEFTPLANSTIKQTITSGTYTFTPSFAQRTAGLSAVTVGSIAVGAPYSRDLEIGDTIVVNISDDTYDGVHKITGIASEGGTYKLRFQQYSNVADSANAAVTGTVSVPGFMTTANAPQLDSRISTIAGNIADLNPDWKWSPRNPEITRAISNVARTTTTATITTSAPHGFGVDRVVTIALTNGPTGYADLNGSFVIASVPTDSTFTYATITSGTITSGAGTGTAACAGEITPTPMKGGTLAKNLQYAVERGNGVFYLGAGTLDGGGNLTIPLNVKSKALSDLITNGLYDADRTVSVSKITSPASTTKTVITAYPHGLYTGYAVTISGATGTNAADVNGNTYTVTVTSSTTFTFTAATSNTLNLTGGSIAIVATSGWSVGSYSVDTTGTTGPYGVGNSLYYVGADHQDAELGSANRIAVTAGEKYFLSWRVKAEHYNKAHLHVKFYNAGGTAVGDSHGYNICKLDGPNDEWSRNYGLIQVPATATQMTPVLHHDSFASSHSVYYTDIQAIKLTGAFGFSDRVVEDETYYNNLTSGSIDLRDFENPSAPEESGEASNRIYVYAPYTTEDPLTGAKQLISYRNTYDFVQGVWSAGGKRIEASIVELNATDETTALLTAQQYFKERGISLRSFEFEHISGPLNVGDVIPFIWNELGMAEALVVRRQVGYLIGQEVFYRVQLGGDMSFQRSTMYLVERRLKEITGDAAYFSPPPSPYPGYPTEGGIVTPATPTGDAGVEKVDISWEYPQSIISSASFGGFVVLRSGDAGSNWVKASTGEAILTAQNPLAPDTAVPSFTDTNVAASVGYIYRVAAVDVSGATPILTQYSSDSATLTPTTASGADFADAYDGLGINVPKIITSITNPTYTSSGVAKTISGIVSGASTTATVSTSTSHGFSTGYIVGITGAAGANAADVNGGFYIITVVSATTFNITKTGTNVLSLTGGTANGYQVSGAFSDKDGNARVLGDAFSLVQFPVGQIAYSEQDGKLYRNGKHGAAAWDNYWTRASVDAIDVTSDGSVVISADKITTGTLNAANVAVTNLDASNITTGTLTSIAINAGAGTFSVTSGGALTASSATITGSVTATSGTIGGWTVTTSGDDRLHAGSGSSFVGLSTGATAIFAGASSSSGTNPSFSVTNDGAVAASDITITGGSFDINGNFIVDENGDLTAYAARFNPEGKPAITLQGNSDEGDIAVPDGNRLDIGHTSPGNVFTIGARMSSGKNWTFYGNVTINGNISATSGLGGTVDDGSITTPKLADGAVATAKIASGAVNSAALAADAVTSAKIAADAVTSVKIAAGAVGTLELADLAVTQQKIAADAVTNSKINDGAVQSNSLGTNAVVYGKINDNAVGTANIIDLSITSGKLASDSVTTAKIASEAVTSLELSSTAIFKSVTPTNVAAIANAGCGWSGTGSSVSLRRYNSGAMTSERAFKSDISPISAETDKYELLNWITFRYDAQKMRDYGLVSAGIDYEVGEELRWGLIADEVEALFPEAVSTDISDGVSYRGLRYDTLRALEGVVIKDLIGRVKSLEARVAELENK